MSHTFLILALRRQRQKDLCEFKASHSNTERPRLKQTNKTKTRNVKHLRLQTFKSFYVSKRAINKGRRRL